MATVTLKNINKVYDGNVHAVVDFNLKIKDKEFIVFVGPSGCGKTTTLRMVAGLDEIVDKLKALKINPKQELNEYLLSQGKAVINNVISAFEFIKRPDIDFNDVTHYTGITFDYSNDILEQVLIEIKGSGTNDLGYATTTGVEL